MRTIRLFLSILLIACPIGLHSASIRSGTQSCPTSGIKQLSSTQTKASWIAIQAPQGNTGVIAIGGSGTTVAAACAPGAGVCIGASSSFFLPPVSNSSAYDLSQTFIACTVSADTVVFTYLQ